MAQGTVKDQLNRIYRELGIAKRNSACGHGPWAVVSGLIRRYLTRTELVEVALWSTNGQTSVRRVGPIELHAHAAVPASIRQLRYR